MRWLLRLYSDQSTAFCAHSDIGNVDTTQANDCHDRYPAMAPRAHRRTVGFIVVIDDGGGGFQFRETGCSGSHAALSRLTFSSNAVMRPSNVTSSRNCKSRASTVSAARSLTAAGAVSSVITSVIVSSA